MQTTATIILAILLVLAVGALVVGYAAWRNRRRFEATQAEAQGGSGGGPKEPA